MTEKKAEKNGATKSNQEKAQELDRKKLLSLEERLDNMERVLQASIGLDISVH